MILTAGNTYSGGTTLQAGTLVLNRTGNGAGVTIAGTIAIHGGTLLLGQANQINDSSAIIMEGGNIDTGGFADRVGRLTVNGNAAIRGLVASSGAGVATGSDFLFSGVDLSNYATGSGGILDLGGAYGAGTTINFASSDFTGWTGYSTTSLNQFADKIVFGDTGMKAQISFNSTSGLTYLTAVPVPEAEVKVTAALLVGLVGLAEFKRRRVAGGSWKRKIGMGPYLSQGVGETSYMKKMKTCLAIVLGVLAGGVGWAGDGLYDEGGAYAGTVSRTFWQDSSGQYGGSVSANGSLSTASGEYAGRIQANGSITLADGSYGGHVAGWKAKGRE